MKTTLLTVIMLCLTWVLATAQTTYDFGDGSVFPQNTSTTYATFTTTDDVLTIAQGTGSEYAYHDATHGLVLDDGNTFTIAADQYTIITFNVCVYSSDGTLLRFTDESGTDLGTIEGESKNGGNDGDAKTFVYSGTAQNITATIESSGSVYMHEVVIENKDFATVSGNISVPAEIPVDYTVIYTNTNGHSWSTTPSSGTYSVDVPVDYNYTITLGNADDYAISSAIEVSISGATSNDITVSGLTLYTLSGSITGFADSEIDDLSLSFTPSVETDYEPVVEINTVNQTYSVDLESNLTYNIAAIGVNNYAIASSSTATISANTSSDITFAAKPTYAITINSTNSATGSELTTAQQAACTLLFENLEDNYTYSFSLNDAISLRNGTYSITCLGVEGYALEMALTANITVAGSIITKAITFNQAFNWPFNDQTISGTNYKGLTFNSSVNQSLSQGHIGVSSGNTVTVPISANQKAIIHYYYAAAFTIDGGSTTYTTVNSTNSTSTKDVVEYTYTGIGSSIDIDVSGTTYFTNIKVVDVVDYSESITVGVDKDYQTINEALNAITLMDRPNSERVSVVIDPGNYEEMLTIDLDNISLINASGSPSISLSNNGVDIDANAVRITSYYGHGYNYYSMGSDQKWNADELTVNIQNGYISNENVGAGTTNGSYWNATVVVYATGFEAENIIIENSFNQYISLKESQDVVEEWTTGGKGTRPVTAGNISVQNKAFVERAAALAIQGGDRVVLNNCRIVGHQDTFFGGTDSRVAIYKGVVMGGTDYIFGAMNATFFQTELALTTSDDVNDVAYITAAQQSAGKRGYLMYECSVTSATPGADIGSTYSSKPGYFGRPWEATTSEVVFYNTTIGTTNYVGNEGESLIAPQAWSSSLGGESALMYEYNTTELSGVNNSSSRASWATSLATPTLTDGTAITTFNFTKGDDSWDPIAEIQAEEVVTYNAFAKTNSNFRIEQRANVLVITNSSSALTVKRYSINGTLVSSMVISSDTEIIVPNGLWIIQVASSQQQETIKFITNE